MKNRRPQLTNKLADVIHKEFKCKRFTNSRLGSSYEELKTKLRLCFSEAELIQLSLLAAAVVVDANYLCKVTEIRGKEIVPFHKDSVHYKGS